ncbi:FMN-linked oxidoreductase [Mytilinidion resinicola]|uniref:FMN-linked oxidoreductase n=1 Tax=Mytilinidion resinicola TaxID=574789 RepID=A0A6A6Y9A1_9PEZI|nr:FMN-linked oxidoreductase [Mytilinidion resinicola]KAF2805270.1 FMN-linked oxidoreductase [Mytilinidion resinicola]
MAPIRFTSTPTSAAPLAQPLKYSFSGRTAPNRLLKAAMSESMSSYTPENHSTHGIPSNELVKLYEAWGEGGFGQILTGNVMLFDDQLEGPKNAIIPQDAEFEGERFEKFKAIATGAKKHGSLIVAQVSHPGRQVEAKVNPHPISASDVAIANKKLGRVFAKPRPATESELAEIASAFGHAAEFLDKAGFDGIELHGAHGYLIAQFLSLTTNRRTDKYGGSLANRMRFLLEIAAAIKKRVSSSFILGVKINSVEFQDHGFTPDEATLLVTELEKAEFDYVELSGGTYESILDTFRHKRESTRIREGFFVDFAEQICKPLTKTKAYLTGGFRTTGAMVKALDTGVDGIGLGRPTCHEPLTFGKDLLEGRISGAIKVQLDDGDFASTAAAGATNMKLVSEGKEVLDFSNEDFVKSWRGEFAKLMEAAGVAPQKGEEEVVKA